MPARILFYFLFTFFQLTLSYGQAATAAELAKAEAEEKAAKNKFSKDHIDYTKAAINLAKFYYQDSDKQENADSLVIPALRFIKKIFTANSEQYKHALDSIPSSIASFIYVEFDIEETLSTLGGSKSPTYAKHLITRSISWLNNFDSKGHIDCLDAFRILALYPTLKNKEIYEYAYQNIDSVIISLVEHKIELEKEKSVFPNTITYADALIRFVKLNMQYQDRRTNDFDIDSSYIKIKDALDIYQTKIDTTSKAYHLAFQTLTPKMQAFYPIERDIYDRIKRHETTSQLFIPDLRIFLRKVDSVNFLDYSQDYIFEKVLNDIQKHHGGSSNKYYSIIKAIQSKWGLDENENNLDNQVEIVKQQLAGFGPNSKEYAEALLYQAHLEVDEWAEEKALANYLKAFDVLDEVEFNLPIIDFAGENLFQKYIKTVRQPWNVYIINERNLRIKKSFGKKNESYAEALFETGWNYISTDELERRGKGYYRDALRALPNIPSSHNLAVKWLDSLFIWDAELGIEVIENVLSKYLPLPIVLKVLKAPLDSMVSHYGKYSLKHSIGLELIADAYFFAKGHPKQETESLRLYRNILTSYKNREDLSSNSNYEELLKKIVRNLKELDLWDVTDGIFFFEKLLDVLYAKQSNPNILASYINKYAAWHYYNQRYIEAEPLYQSYIKIYSNKSAKKEKNPTYLEALYNLARIYRKTGRYVASNNAYTTALKANTLANASSWSIKCFDDLGLLSQKMGQEEVALKFFNASLDLLEKIEKENFQKSRYKDKETAEQYIKIIRHIGRFYLDIDDLYNAQKRYTIVKNFKKNNPSVVNLKESFSLHRDLAILYEKLGEDNKAIDYYNSAIDSIANHEKKADKGEKAEITIAFANYYRNQGQDSLATFHFLNALALDLEQIESNYSNLSEKERLLYLDPIAERVNSFFSYTTEHPDSILTTNAINAHLTIKGLALETTTNIQNVCYESNVKLNKDCAHLQQLRKKIAKSLSKSIKEQEELNDKIIALEKKIGLSSKNLRDLYGKNNKKLDFYQLQQILKAMETEDSVATAIDFLVLNETDNYGDKVSTYYALIVNSVDNTPHFVKLATEEELEDVLNLDISSNTINYITDELESRYLYELVWEPMLPFIKNVKRVHLCPTGILSKIVFGTLRTDDNSSKRIMDDWSIHYYSSFRDLLNPQVNENISEPENILLIGGVKFTFPESQFSDSLQSHAIDEKSIDINASLEKEQITPHLGVARGEDFNYLPGTLEEIDSISELFKTWERTVLKGSDAIEERVIRATDNSPAIIHIATHGFFFSAPKDDNDDWSNSSKETNSLEYKISNLTNPLLRSGLALANINRVWRGGEEIDGLEDGILTALEVANMDLFNTKLVVLSACETGRGDIDNNEGIMGLQRAFKTAGAKQLIISLWKVPDDQTSELMQLFYKEYLSGISAHKAFEIAQHKMRKLYPNPYFWAAFLLIE
jgi:CHAT domain-containing protein/tetratricopeptide (TPR) repeat protein